MMECLSQAIVLCHGNLDLFKKGFFLQAEEKALKKVRRKIKNKVSNNKLINCLLSLSS